MPDLPLGGVERQMGNLAAGFVERGVPVDLVLADGTDARCVDVHPRVEVVDLGARRTALAVIPLVRYLRTRAPVALISAKDHANVVAILAGRFAPRTAVLVTVHAQPSAALAAPESWTGHVVRRMIRMLYPRAGAVVAVSQGVERDVVKLAPKARPRTRVIPNPVITPALRAAVVARLRPEDWTDHDDAPVFVWCGRLSTEKDPLLALEAFARVRSTLRCALVFVGDGPLADDVRESARSLGVHDDVRITGFVVDALPYLGAADVVVLSSRREGLPTVLIEALAAGTPIVSTDCRSGPSEILGGGRLGRLVPVGDVDALASAMVDALRSPRNVATDHDLSNYTLDGALNAYTSVLTDLGVRIDLHG